MKRISFYNSNRSGNLLHIETEGCIVNIRVNLSNNEGEKVTIVEVVPDRNIGEEWHIDTGSSFTRVKEGKEKA